MAKTVLRSVVEEINLRARQHSIGALQEIRKGLKKLERAPSRTIFAPATTFDEYAFHNGGRKELQFNVGIEHLETDELRYGVAFSLERNQTLPSIDVLIPKVRLFNDFVQLYPDEYADMRMWHYQGQLRGSDYMPTTIAPELVAQGNFIFLGKHLPIGQIDYRVLLDDLERLVPLYRYTESGGSSPPISTVTVAPFEFRAGLNARTPSSHASFAQRELDIDLRHNVLQRALHLQLTRTFGAQNVGGELPSGVGTRIDAVVRVNGEFRFYEIKTAKSPRACLREAIGQLLEYSFWPGSQEASPLIVVGETVLDEEGAEYLGVLRQRFGLPIEYEHIVV
jgi:hypothetical protein